MEESSHSMSLEEYCEKGETEFFVEPNDIAQDYTSNQSETVYPENKINNILPQYSNETQDCIKVTSIDIEESENVVIKSEILPLEDKVSNPLPKNSNTHENNTLLGIQQCRSDPVVLLTRVDSHAGIRFPGNSYSNQEMSTKSHKTVNQKLIEEPASTLSNHEEINGNFSNHKSLNKSSSEKTRKKLPKTCVDAQVVKQHKYQKHKSNSLLHNNHKSQGKSEKQSTRELSGELVNSEEKTSKHERREKHKHKHSLHSSSRGSREQGGGTLKITIPKGKICLDPNPGLKKSLKIKIGKSAIAPGNPVVSGLKLVLTKDKSGSGSYSTCHKAESRKRTHSQVETRRSTKASKHPMNGLDGAIKKTNGEEPYYYNFPVSSANENPEGASFDPYLLNPRLLRQNESEKMLGC